MSGQDREQKLVDICFEVALTIGENTTLRNLPKEKLAEWVARQLRLCGFDTEPQGSCWGVLRHNQLLED